MTDQSTTKPTLLSLFDYFGRLSRRLWVFTVLFLTSCIALTAIDFIIFNQDQPHWIWLVIKVGLLTGIGLIVLGAASCVKSCLYQPLQSVMTWATEIRQGNLAARISAEGAGEYFQPLDDINRASEWLESLAQDKEQQLLEQMSENERKSRSLTLLYEVASGINDGAEIRTLASRFMHTLTYALGAEGASIRLLDPENNFILVDEVGLGGGLLEIERVVANHPQLTEPDFSLADAVSEMDTSDYPDVDYAQYELMVVPLRYLDRINGIYLFFLPSDYLEDFDQFGRLLTSIGRQLGMAVEKSRLDYEAHLIPRMQERANLAHELHDSLAQTLASLRFQVRVLDDTLHQNDESAVWAEMERVESSLEEANTELRELITHFRAPINQRGLVPSIQGVLSRFRKETGIETFFQNQWDEVELAEETEVHVLRIVQESLANIRKHSGASAVRVLLNRDSGHHWILIEDDGEGFRDSDYVSLDDHFGLSIMRERAEQIGGELKLESELGEGTRVWLVLNE